MARVERPDPGWQRKSIPAWRFGVWGTFIWGMIYERYDPPEER